MGHFMNNVAVLKQENVKYSKDFRPSIAYPEYPFHEYSKENEVYEMVRSSLYLMGLDAVNYNSANWNPFGGFIKPGMKVLIKPNMVLENNRNPKGSNESLYTNPSVVAPVIDYVIIALKGKGSIVIGDAPVQECNFEALIENSGYKELVDYYISKGVDVEIADFRGVKSAYEHGLLHSEINNASSGIVVNLAENSSFSNLSENELKRLRITNYKKDILLEHHNSSVHEYSISEYVLSADVIINIPKPKSHRIAGFTAALKNFVGANTRKEFLPHHTLGTPQNGGDESDVGGMLMRVRAHCLDKKNDYEYSHRYLLAKLNVLLVRIFSYLTRIQRSSYREGCWYGNRTISKTIRDINKIVYYSDKNGVIHENIQRTVLSIADMIIAGEGEGPMAPSDKYVGMIVAGFNPVNVDRTIAAIMGFDEKKVPFLADMLGMPQEKWIIKTNIIENGSINIEQAKEVLNQHFLATSGWKNHIELQSV